MRYILLLHVNSYLLAAQETAQLGRLGLTHEDS